MNRRIARTAPGILAAAAVLSGCVSQGANSASDPTGGSSADDGTVTITLHPGGCKPHPGKVDAGVITFSVHNEDAGRVSEAELVSGGRMLGERENLSPGLSGEFTLRLSAGEYQIYCPGADQERWSFAVTGQSATTWKDNKALVKAVGQYQNWVEGQVDKLVRGTEKFAAAIKAGDMARARELYPASRVPYERIEPVAETFGALDKNIDGRINDFARRTDFTGFHKLEQLLFAKNTLQGAQPVAKKLVGNVSELRRRVAKSAYQPAELAGGATALIDEIQATKVTGEEERYSHTDLIDIEANLQGALKAFTLLKPALQKIDPDLVTTISQRVDAVHAELAKLRTQPGYLDTGYPNYTTVSQQQRRTLSHKVNALGDALSKVTTKVA